MRCRLALRSLGMPQCGRIFLQLNPPTISSPRTAADLTPPVQQRYPWSTSPSIPSSLTSKCRTQRSAPHCAIDHRGALGPRCPGFGIAMTSVIPRVRRRCLRCGPRRSGDRRCGLDHKSLVAVEFKTGCRNAPPAFSSAAGRCFAPLVDGQRRQQLFFRYLWQVVGFLSARSFLPPARQRRR